MASCKNVLAHTVTAHGLCTRPQKKSHGAVPERTNASVRSFAVCSGASKRETDACCSHGAEDGEPEV